MASAPFVGESDAPQVAIMPPPSSSLKTTLVPVSLNVAACQMEKLAMSVTRWSTRGFTGSEMSRSQPSPKHAAAARPFSG